LEFGKEAQPYRASIVGSIGFLVMFSAACWAHPAEVRIPLTIPSGSPLRIKLTRRVPIKKVGVRVEGRLIAPVYVYNRKVLPKGTLVLGKVVEVQGISRLARARAIMAGDFTPWRTAKVRFNTLVLADGKRLSIQTRAAQGEPQVVRLTSGASKRRRHGRISRAIANAKRQLKMEKQQALGQWKGPGKLHRLWRWAKSVAVARLPYHRQSYPPGTEFTAALRQSLNLGIEQIPAKALDAVGTPPPANSVVHARLTTPLDSATAKRGMTVEALVTRPLYSPKKELLIPQGTRLVGKVVRARPAGWLHRDGSLRFTFVRLEPPATKPEFVPGSLQAVVVPKQAHLTLGQEGGVKPKTSKKRYLTPALSIALAAMTATPDRDAVRGAQAGAAVPAQGGALGAIAAGGWGLGLIGSVAALAAQSRWVSAALGFYSAAGAVYSNIIARGHDVDFPANTPMEIRLGNHHPPASRLKLPHPTRG
jgi:hypothetical protein